MTMARTSNSSEVVDRVVGGVISLPQVICLYVFMSVFSIVCHFSLFLECTQKICFIFYNKYTVLESCAAIKIVQ